MGVFAKKREELNDLYKILDFKKNELVSSLNSLDGGFNCDVGYYNGHYSKDEDGEYQIDFFPIPVISVMGLCDIEINLDAISVSTKLTREKAIQFEYNKLISFEFEVYGVEDYLSDYYMKDGNISNLVKRIKESNEKNIGFSFLFNKDIDGKSIHELTSFLVKNCFFY